ncbi:MAG: mannitol-1-phosphate 5-dehydrogenase [Clostridiaceae bacterium]|nr:mannitol-1-phosphate 5-dehydrogenase [Clostridiaceae bacterium]
MKGVIIGAGSVGRGFIGELLSDANFEICFIDIDENIIDGINLDNSYPHITVSNDKKKLKWIRNVRAINSQNESSVIREIANANLIITSLGVNALSNIAPLLAKAILHRINTTGKAINILLCENLHNVDQYMQQLLLQYIEPDLHSVFLQKVGLLATAIGRMIPLATEEDKKIHPAVIKVEPYKFLPYDGFAAKTGMPKIQNLIWDKSVDFNYYSDRKLYIHNFGHCLTAYLANYFGYEYIWQAIQNNEIRYYVRTAMLEVAIALSLQYEKSILPILDHVDDLIFRFANRTLNDTCERVGRDPQRKLKAGDRFLGALQMCLENKVKADFVLGGVAIGLVVLANSCKLSDVNDIKLYLEQECPLIFDDKYKREKSLLFASFKFFQNKFDTNSFFHLLEQHSIKGVI